MKIENSRSAGFSLIEVVFAMLFITVIVMGVVNLQTSNLGLLNSQNSEVQAHFLANEGLEILEAIDFATINNNCPTRSCTLNATLPGGNYVIRDIIVGGEEEKETIDGQFEDQFQRTFELNATDLTEAFLVTAFVTWEDSTGEHETQAKRIISE